MTDGERTDDDRPTIQPVRRATKIAMALVAIFLLYVGSYFVIIRSVVHISPGIPGSSVQPDYREFFREPGVRGWHHVEIHQVLEILFAPVHQLDRRYLRRELWGTNSP
jgi:hypothetical protein